MTAPAGPKLSLREAQRVLTRKRICDAASHLFYEQGFPAVTMEDIAHAAGVSRSTLYLHYVDKTALSVEIAAAYADSLCALVARLPGPVPTRVQITHWINDLAALIAREHVPATLIVDLSARSEAPAATGLIGDRLIAALANQLPSLARTLERDTTRPRAQAWAEVAMRELGWACSHRAGDHKDARSARLTVAAEIFERFIQAQIEMEA